ncbi:DUF4231 domain-containing protein [Hyphococcus sp.]|uniref:DUF4231 domain-containing protein n=1 Tax=Hyphococcus sp. TaxID=2038636 RepID=UPI0035C73917
MNFLFRKDYSYKDDSFSSPVEYYSAVRRGLREKANHNKIESQASFYAIICFTLLVPLFVTLGDGWFFGKLVPAVLSVLASASTAWLQLRKPQRLWAIYRRAQRELEREKAAFDFNLAPYDNGDDADKKLAQRVSDIAFNVHEQWEGLVPEADALTSSIIPAVTIPHSGTEDVK